MRTPAVSRHGKRASERLRAIRRKAAEWKRRAKRAVTLALITAGAAAAPSIASAQMGQMGMAPSGGLVNRAVTAFQGWNETGPGFLYYGINAADRGLGYNGSYMTLGGFIPYSQDDLGGLWNADVRTHLSVNGGFFGNFGLVRKQFLGGSLLGIGVYYDYDADANQYDAFGTLGTPFGQFGHVYNQVGVSGEWLTDFGNLRSNGYMPVGTTSYTAGAPNYPFYKNYVMCQYGLDAALSGADLEVGAYIPGLSDWAGMISVGGYALGNSRYDWGMGPQATKDVVPWFGGVYTRLDMTFVENWDFSLQANNDSYFDWTGFARLTYRMGGSRRRNVPDQMEQPMMRNEHIVRAHQTPIVALNADNGNQPWRVIHVDNSAPAGGTGAADSPLNTLAEGSAAATNPWDIVFLHQGLSRTTTPYGGSFAFQAENQYLIGDGGSFLLPTLNCGPESLSTGGLLPLLSNPAGASVNIDGTKAGGATVADLDILGSQVGILASGNLTAAKPTLVQNVTISGNGTAASQRGVSIEDATGAIDFRDVAIENMTNVGFAVTQGSADISYQGSIRSNVADNGGVATPIIEIKETSGGTISLAAGSAPAGSTVPNDVTDIGGDGIVIQANGAATTIDISNVTLTDSVRTAIAVLNDNSTTTITAGSGSGIDKKTTGAAITVQDGGTPTFAYSGPISNARPTDGTPTSYLLNVSDTLGGSVALTSPAGTPFVDTGDGIRINNAASDVTVGGAGATIASSGAQGILIDNGSSGTFQFNNVTITKATNEGVLINQAPGTSIFRNLNISLAEATAVGLRADTAGIIETQATNTIATTSDTQPAVQIVDSGPIAMTFTTISSGLPNATGTALQFLGATTGGFSASSAFTVGGSAGTTANNVDNSAGIALGGLLGP